MLHGLVCMGMMFPNSNSHNSSKRVDLVLILNQMLYQLPKAISVLGLLWRITMSWGHPSPQEQSMLGKKHSEITHCQMQARMYICRTLLRQLSLLPPAELISRLKSIQRLLLLYPQLETLATNFLTTL